MLVDTDLENARQANATTCVNHTAPVQASGVMFEGAGCSTCYHGNAPQTYRQTM